jgi:hypothetical protein
MFSCGVELGPRRARDFAIGRSEGKIVLRASIAPKFPQGQDQKRT